MLWSKRNKPALTTAWLFLICSFLLAFTPGDSPCGRDLCLLIDNVRITALLVIGVIGSGCSTVSRFLTNNPIPWVGTYADYVARNDWLFVWLTTIVGFGLGWTTQRLRLKENSGKWLVLVIALSVNSGAFYYALMNRQSI
jgi:hypothetical protein